MNRNAMRSLTSMAMLALPITLPAQRFFTPTDFFWEYLKGLDAHKKSVIEVGAGAGDLVIEAYDHEFVDYEGLDMYERDGANHIRIANALEETYLPGQLVICCRPNHSGWSSHVLDMVLEAGASFAYVGLEKNIEHDLTDDQQLSSHVEVFNVGKEEELLIGWGPLFKGN